MVEDARSIELKRNISAKEAYKRSIRKELVDKRAFICKDPNCGINLTCTNFGKINGKKFYFTPSFHETLHILDCTEISLIDRKKQVGMEKESAKSTIEKDGTIRMTKSNSLVKTNIQRYFEEENEPGFTNETKNNNNRKIKRETRNIYSIASFVGLYLDSTIDNELQKIKINSEIISLNQLFIPAGNTAVGTDIRIYMGTGKINTFKKDMIKIVFSDFSKYPIFTNKNKIIMQNEKLLLKYLDENKEIKIYFRGYFGKTENKFKYLSFHNNSIYKDLYFDSTDNFL